MSRDRYHDEYTAWCGECRCAFCQPVPLNLYDPEPELDDDARDEALEWGGIDL